MALCIMYSITDRGKTMAKQHNKLIEDLKEGIELCKKHEALKTFEKDFRDILKQVEERKQ